MVRVCPNCGCDSISTERRPNGNSTCSNCKMHTKTSVFLIVDATLVVDGFYTELSEKPAQTNAELVDLAKEELTYSNSTVSSKLKPITMKLIEILRKDFNIIDIKETDISKDISEIGIDSLDAHELYLAIEEEWGITIPSNNMCTSHNCTLIEIIISIYNVVNSEWLSEWFSEWFSEWVLWGDNMLINCNFNMNIGNEFGKYPELKCVEAYV